MLNNLGLGFVFTAHDLASGKMQRLERNFSSLDQRVGLGTERITSNFRDLGLGLGVFTAGAATVAGAFALADKAGKFEEAIAAVAAVSGATTSELQLLKTAAIEAGIATQFSPTDATVGLQELAQAGFNAHESVGLLIPVLDLAAGSLGELTPAAAAGLAAQAMKAFGIATADASITVDRMLQAVNVFALKASDLPLALGIASRGAGALKQSMTETLIAVGLVKNVIPGTERASTAVAVAMERMVDPKVQQMLKGIGTTVVDSQGHFRSFLDILGEMGPSLDKMTDAKRSAFLLDVFGKEALAGVNAILVQTTAGIRTNTGETLKGAAALNYLRTQFESAGGTAANFRDKMLDTFAGQKQLLRGSMETLAIVLGQPFAQVLKLVVAAVVDALNVFLKIVRTMPEPVKKAFATLVVGAGAVTTLIGAVMTLKAGTVLLGIGMKVLGLSAGGMLASLLPAVAIVAALAAAFFGFKYAIEHNLGGIGDVVNRAGAAISLFFGGLKQLVEQGGFSGAVREELNRTENQGLKGFLITIAQVVFRIQRIWEGFSAGFTAAMEAARPVFAAVGAAFADLGNELGELFATFTGAAAGLPSDRFRAFGEAVGSAIGQVVRVIGEVVGVAASFWAGMISGVRSVWGYIGPAFRGIGNAIGQLVQVLGTLFGVTAASGSVAADMGGAFRTVGEYLGKAFGFALAAVAWGLEQTIRLCILAVQAVLWVKDAFVAAGTWIGETAAKIVLFFTETLPTAISSAIAWVGAFFRGVGEFLVGIGRWFLGLFDSIAEGIRSFLQPVFDFFNGIADSIRNALTTLRDFVIQILREIPDELLPSSLERMSREPLSAEIRTDASAGGSEVTAARAEAASSAMPAAADARARSGDLAELQSNLLAAANGKSAGGGQPFVVNVQVDGETIARAANRASADSASRSFSPVPSF